MVATEFVALNDERNRNTGRAKVQPPIHQTKV
jgi:hypothetical protein